MGDALEDLSDLGGILSLLGGDKLKSIVSISSRKLGRTSTNGYLHIRMMFSAKPGYGTDVYTSR